MDTVTVKDMSIQKSEHEKMAGKMRTMERKVEQIDKRVTQQGNTLARLEQQLETKLQCEFTSRRSADGMTRHRCTITYKKGATCMRNQSEYFSTEEEAKEHAARKMEKEVEKSRSLTVTVSKRDPETPHRYQWI